jgi:hypothetical protein
VRHRILQGFLAFLAICFAVQIFSPLRLDTDSVVLLSVADSVAHGGGFMDNGQKTVFSPGYPALLAVLIRTGLAHSWSFIGLNVILLAVGLFATYSLLIREFFADNENAALTVCSLFLLSFVVIKHFTIPLTDVPFFSFAMCCLAVASRATKIDSDGNRNFFVLALVAWLLALAALALRRIGIALFPALVFMMLSSLQFRSFLKHRRTKAIIGLVFVVVGITTVSLVANTPTLMDVAAVTSGRSASSVVFSILLYRLTEFGELLLNLPLSKMPMPLHALVPWVGAVLIVLTIFGLATKRSEIKPTEVFMVSYAVILFAWPYYDTRFWLPVIPLLIAYSVLSLKTFRLPVVMKTTYCVAFVALGLIAIVYSSRISFAGSRFPDRYGDGTLRPTYCAAFQSCQDAGDSRKVNTKALRLLRKYN